MTVIGCIVAAILTAALVWLVFAMIGLLLASPPGCGLRQPS